METRVLNFLIMGGGSSPKRDRLYVSVGIHSSKIRAKAIIKGTTYAPYYYFSVHIPVNT